jgi:spermidine/putrescine ABC transporter ATP-binding subunit
MEAANGRGGRVQMQGIAKQYGLHRALDTIDLDIRAGEFITFLGPSGSGKTTLLMLIAGFERPSGGEILIDARPVARLPPYRRDIGMVFQSYALFPHMNVAENIAFPLKQRGVSLGERRAAVKRMLDLVQLSGYEARYPQQLSGGQQQRVAIARAVVFNPRVLLMDEPLSALDKQLRESLQLEIKGLHDRLGITFVYVTHDQREALVMSDRVSVMRAGRIEQVAPPQEIYDAPANRFVASFVGEANFAEIEEVTAGADGAALARTSWGCTMRVQDQSPAKGGACMIRPEKMSVLTGEYLIGAFNSVAADVRDVVFMGETTRYALTTDTGQTVLVRQQNRSGARTLRAGERALVAWDVADTRVVA